MSSAPTPSSDRHLSTSLPTAPAPITPMWVRLTSSWENQSMSVWRRYLAAVCMRNLGFDPRHGAVDDLQHLVAMGAQEGVGLVGMVGAHLHAIGLLDGGKIGAALDTEHRIGVGLAQIL